MVKSKKSNAPKCSDDIANNIVHYGAFKDGLDFLTNIFNSHASTSIILRGNLGSGKMTLVEEAERLCGVLCIYLNPNHFHDDFSAMKYIAQALKLRLRPSLQDMMEDIEERCGTTDKKIVIVLSDFEEFCRQKQSLLYCLTNLTQHGDNISLLGITRNLDCTECLEKRVRSRLNTLFHELSTPYRSKAEYVEFASLLLGGAHLPDKLVEQLEFMYLTGNRSIRPLKRYLLSICTWDEEGVFCVNAPCSEQATNPQNDFSNMADRFSWLTRSQRELLKLAVCYCNSHSTAEFSLHELRNYACRINYHRFQTNTQECLKNTLLLCRVMFLKTRKLHQEISQSTVFVICVAPKQLRALCEQNQEHSNIKTDPLWKRLH